jgi:hypothetical protein
MWTIILLGSLIALPFFAADMFGSASAPLKSTGTLVANVGVPLEDVEKRSTLKLATPTRINSNGSRMTAGGAVFDWEVANTGLRFENCRYYWLETYEHDDTRLKKLNIGVSPQKIAHTNLLAAERQIQERLQADHWKAGHFVHRTEKEQVLHGGATTSGEGKYWLKDGTLLILSSKRMDEEKRGEDPQTAGEFILVLDLVPRDDSLYSKLEFNGDAAQPKGPQ